MTLKARSLVDEAMRQLYFKAWREACIVTDHDLKVLEFTGDLERYGLQDLAVGDDAAERMDFMVGVRVGASMCLPVVVMSSGELAEVYIDTWDCYMVIVLYVATTEQRYYFELQRRNGEVRLLMERQKRLLRSLTQAREDLKSRSAELESLNELKSRFIARMSHEFRTPLTSILGYTQLMGGDPSLDEENRTRLDSVDRAARHLLGMVESILDQARIEAGELSVDLRPTDVYAMLHGLDALFLPIASERGLRFGIEGVDGLPERVEADELRLRQILVNVISNALKYTPRGRVLVSVSWSDAWLDVSVRDTGPGIPEQDRERVFTPFQRLSHARGTAGAGLGLAITRSLVELMGGLLTLETEPGWGSVFRLQVPAPAVERVDADEIVAPESSAFEPSSGTATGEPVLVVEDDDDIARLLCVVLSEAGYVPSRARDGQVALDMIEADDYALVLMDMNMPVLDGEQATRRMRQGGFPAPVIGLSASVGASDRAIALAAGCNDYLAKPVDLPQLLHAIETWLRREPGPALPLRPPGEVEPEENAHGSAR